MIPSRDAHCHQSGIVTLYKNALIVGLGLLLDPLARDLLIFLSIAPGQLALNGWRFLMGVIHLWPQIFGYELTLQEFLWTYQPFTLFGELDFFSLLARQGKRIIDKC